MNSLDDLAVVHVRPPKYRRRPDIVRVCARAAQIRQTVRSARFARQCGGDRRTLFTISDRAAKWLDNTSHAYLLNLNNYALPDLRRLAFCLSRVASVISFTPPNLRRLLAKILSRSRAHTRRRSNTVGREAEFSNLIYGCTPCVFGWKLCRKNIVPDDGSCIYIGWDTYRCKC
jgi:hypothetical protein